jgi:MFS family permease
VEPRRRLLPGPIELMRRFVPGGLWRHRDFRNLWAAETVSQVGTQVSQLALPLVAIIVLEASAFKVALLGVIEFAPFILISLPAGVWVDRLRRKPILVVSDLGRAVLLASVPVAYWLDALTIWQLYIVGFAVGVLTVFFDVSYQSYLPSVVSRKQLIEGNSKLEISRSGAQLGGPGLGGVLVEVLTAPVAILADAISFLGSALFLLRIKTDERAPTRAERQAGPGMRAEIAEGLRYVLGHRYLRWIAASTATFNFFGNIMFAVFLVFAVRELGLGPGVIGLTLTVSSIGYLVGALLANRVSRRFGVGPAIVIGDLGAIAMLLIPLAPESNPIPFLIAALAISSLGIPIYNITQVSFRQAITPERIQGRMNSVMRFVVWGVMPLGALLGGALATWFSLRTAIWVGAIGQCLAVLPVLLSPVRTLREMPEPVEDLLPSETDAAGGVVSPTQAAVPTESP